MKNQMQKPFVLLNISDIHYSVKNKNVEKVFDNFIKTVSTFTAAHREFTPNALTVVGDIANRGQKEEYKEVKVLIKKLVDTIRPDMDIYVFQVNELHPTFSQM